MSNSRAGSAQIAALGPAAESRLKLAIGSRRLQREPKAAPATNEMDKRPPSRNAELGLSTRAIHHGYDPAEEHGALTPLKIKMPAPPNRAGSWLEGKRCTVPS
jgi:hypothetical protein